MGDQHANRKLLRQSISDLAPGATLELRFDQIGDVFSPGVVGNAIHPKTLSALVAFATATSCTVTKDNNLKVFIFLKRG